MRELSHAEAQTLHGRKLDARRRYALDETPEPGEEGVVFELARWTQACSGCYEGHDIYGGRGNGCDECGYQGRRRQACWLPTLQD